MAVNKEIELLQEQLKLLEQLNTTYKNFVSSREQGSKIDAFITKQMELQSKLEASGLKDLNNQYKVMEALEKVRKKLSSYAQEELSTQETIHKVEQGRQQTNENIGRAKSTHVKAEKDEVENLDAIYEREIKRLSNLNTSAGIEDKILEAKKEQLDYIRDAEKSGFRYTDQQKKQLIEENAKVKALQQQKKILEDIENKKKEAEKREKKSKETIENAKNSIKIPRTWYSR